MQLIVDNTAHMVHPEEDEVEAVVDHHSEVVADLSEVCLGVGVCENAYGMYLRSRRWF